MTTIFDFASTHKDLLIYLAIVAVSIVLYFILQAVAAKLVYKIVKKTATKLDDVILNKKFIRRLVFLVPTFITSRYVYLLGENAATINMFFSIWYSVLFMLIVFSALDAVIEVYEKNETHNRKSIKGYLQIIKIVLGFLAMVVIVGIITEQSPWSILTGLSALTAILLLVFKDTLLSFIVNIQISSNNLIEKGDWIEVPAFAADGTVIDIALHTIKVQNGDNTISIIPTYKLMEIGYKNSRNITELNARRIKRSVIVDPSSIKSIDEELLSKLREKPQIKSFLEEFMESEEYKSSIEIDVTNLMLFRFYIRYFLLKQEKIRGDLNVSARLLQPIESGFPLEIYAFTTETTFSKYENFQAQIFEHIVAFSHYFDIRLFQKTDS